MYQEERNYRVLENQGQKMFAVHHRPKKEGLLPTVVICHGFGGNKIGGFRLFVHMAEALVQQGINVIRIDLRGCGDSEGSFKEMTLDGHQSDLLLWIESIAKESSSLGLLGISLGGPLSLLSSATFPKIESLALWAPVAHSDSWKEDWQKLKNYQVPHVVYNGKVTSKVYLEQFFQLDMEKTLQSIPHIPILHAHGIADTVVPISHQELYKTWTKEHKARTHFITLQESDHHFASLDEQNFLIQETAKWFKETL